MYRHELSWLMRASPHARHESLSLFDGFEFGLTLVSVEASVLASEVAWWNEAVLGAKAAAEPAERNRTAVESFMVS